MSRIVFLDTETTGLVPGVHELWEVALVVRDPGEADQKHTFYLRPAHLERADPAALRVNRFYERTASFGHDTTLRQDPVPGPHWNDRLKVAHKMAQLTANAVLVGLNVQFDERFLGGFLRAHSVAPAWSYQLVELRSAAWGYLRGRADVMNLSLTSPSADLSAACGVGAPAPDVAHAAMVDAVWARDWFDAIDAGGAR